MISTVNYGEISFNGLRYKYRKLERIPRYYEFF